MKRSILVLSRHHRGSTRVAPPVPVRGSFYRPQRRWRCQPNAFALTAATTTTASGVTPSLPPFIPSLLVVSNTYRSFGSKNHSTGKYPSSTASSAQQKSSSRPPKRRQQKNDSQKNSAILNNYIKRRDDLQPYQVALVWNKLWKAVQTLPKWERQNFWSDHKSHLQTLAVHTVKLVDSFDARVTATATHSLAKLLDSTDGKLGRVQSLWNSLLVRTALLIKSDGFNAHDISNLLWAYAKLDNAKVDGLMLEALAKAAIRRVDEFTPQGLANVSWALAALDHSVPSLFGAIAESAQKRMDKFNPQALSNILLAFAKMQYKVPSLFDAIAKAAEARLGEFNPQDLSNTAWAFATLNHQAPSLLDRIARMVQGHICEFKPQALAITVWAFATLNHQAPSLFDAVAKAACIHIVDFNPQELSNTAWAYATLNHEAPLLFDTIATAACTCISNFNPQNLANTAWAFAVLNSNTSMLMDFNSPFAQTLVSTTGFNAIELYQLHQYHLWCQEHNAADWFPVELSCRCKEACLSKKEAKSSHLQKDVVTLLQTLQEVKHVEAKVVTEIGYRLDAVVVYRGGIRIGVEANGPSHFVGRSQIPRGDTILKHRQLQMLEGWKLVSVPYWDWDEINSGSDRKAKKQRYLQNLLDGVVIQ